MRFFQTSVVMNEPLSPQRWATLTEKANKWVEPPFLNEVFPAKTTFPSHREKSLMGTRLHMLHVITWTSDTSHQINLHSRTWRTLATWNNIPLRATVRAPAVSSYCAGTRRSQPEHPPPRGGLKKHSAFWMMPSMIGCDGSQQGRQSGGQNHNTSIVRVGLLHERGQRGAEREEGEGSLGYKEWNSHTGRGAVGPAWRRAVF